MISLYSSLPALDLHGLDRDYAKILINDFIRDYYKIGTKKIIIIHGNGAGILKKMTQETLKKNRYVDDFKIDNFNSGITVVVLKKIVDK